MLQMEGGEKRRKRGATVNVNAAQVWTTAWGKRERWRKEKGRRGGERQNDRLL